MPAASRSTTSNSESAKISVNSRRLPQLLVARRIGGRSAAKRRLLVAVETLDSRNRQLEKLIELSPVERAMFSRALHFHELSLRAHDDVHVDICPDIFVVVEIQSGLTVHYADADCSYTPPDRRRGDLPHLDHPVERIDYRHRSSCYRRSPCAAVGDEHVAIELHGKLAEPEVVQHSAYAPTDQPLAFLSASAELRALACRARSRCARQHRILGSEPTLAPSATPAGNTFFNRGGAENSRKAE